MMDRLFFFLGDIQHTKLGGADSFTDQLNCKYTVFLLSLFAILSTTRVYVSDPISCFCPANFPGSQVDYTDKEHLPKDHEPKNVISYYQWVPLFLALQALLFYLPRPIWRTLSRKSGITLSNITDAAIECQRKTEQEGAEKTMKYMMKYTRRFIQLVQRKRNKQPRCCCFLRIYHANYLTVTFIFVKLLYLGNVVGQLFLLNCFIGTSDYHLYGVDVLRRMAAGKDWTTSARFPRVTICDFHIRTVGNVHRHTVQCALPMNLYNEMLFIFLWFWFVFVAIATVVSMLHWLAFAVCLSSRVSFVRSGLSVASADVNVDDDVPSGGSRHVCCRRCCCGGGCAACDADEVQNFVSEFLLRDGCFVLRLVAENSSDLIAAELVVDLYEMCRNDSVHSGRESTAKRKTRHSVEMISTNNSIDSTSPVQRNDRRSACHAVQLKTL